MIKKLKLLLLLLFVSHLHGYSQNTPSDDLKIIEYVEFTRFIDENGVSSCRQFTRTSEEMSLLEANKNQSELVVLQNTVGRRNGTAGLDIVLRGTPQLLQFPDAVNAFAVAAQRFEDYITNPITVVIDVDYGPTRFGTPWGAGVLGSTASAIVTLNGYTINRFVDSLIERAPGNGDLYAAIPSPVPNTAGASNPLPSGTTPNLQALGILNANGNQLGTVPSIGFNSNFPFDLDPTNGISAGQTDFDAVAVHEIGHALGFVSVIGSSTAFLRTWDFFRFRPGTVTNFSTFTTAQRVNTPGPSPSGGDQVFWDGKREWEVSTARGDRTGGDGQQASHWRDDAQRGNIPLIDRKIGIMDPNLGAGTRDTLKYADWKALGILGWQVTKVDAPSEFSVQSDYQTPTSVELQWRNPSFTIGGADISNLEVILYRNNVPITTLTNAPLGELSTFSDTGLTQYTAVTYTILAQLAGVPESGFPISQSISVGGSPRPAAATQFFGRSNESTVVLEVTAPTRHDDNTILHNLKSLQLYRTNTQPQNLIADIALSTTDTGKKIIYTDTPPRRSIPIYSYIAIYTGDAPSGVNATGTSRATPNVRGGIIQNTNYLETFETSRQSVVEETVWDSTNTLAYQGNWSFAALNYDAGINTSAYIPQIRLTTGGELRFWTIFRAGIGDVGLVEVSKNRGESWSEVLSLSRDTHPEWAAGQNVWFEKVVPLTSFNTDTIVTRFRLNSQSGGFGWLLDDISLSQGSLSTENPTSKPYAFSLEQNYPNPFNPSTTIQYELATASNVKLAVYDILGREVSSLVNARQSAGRYRVSFNASALSSGVYFYRLDTQGFTKTNKMLFVK